MKKLYGLFLVGMLCAGLSAQGYGEKDDYAAAAGYGTISVNCRLVDSARGAAVNNGRVYIFFKSGSNVRVANVRSSDRSGNYRATISSSTGGQGYISVRAVGYKGVVLQSLNWNPAKSYTYPIALERVAKGGVVRQAGLSSSFYGAKDPDSESAYGDGHFYEFPSGDEWKNGAQKMFSYFSNPRILTTQIQPVLIWTVAEYDSASTQHGCYLDFDPGVPVNNTTIKLNNWDELDCSEYLSYFDSTGVKLFLQVESGNADMSKLIELVFNKMKPSEHRCIAGFGVDTEFFQKNGSSVENGVAVTDDDAKSWETKIKSYNSTLKLFLKHWLTGHMPVTYRGDIIFVTDSQDVSSLAELSASMQSWSSNFAPNDVMYQYGYWSDKHWWNTLTAPQPETAGNYLVTNAAAAGQNVGLVWVDFTMREIPDLGFYKNYSAKYSLTFRIYMDPYLYTPTGTPQAGFGTEYTYAKETAVSYAYTITCVPGAPVPDWLLCSDWPTRNDAISKSGTLTMNHDHKFFFKMNVGSPQGSPAEKRSSPAMEKNGMMASGSSNQTKSAIASVGERSDFTGRVSPMYESDSAWPNYSMKALLWAVTVVVPYPPWVIPFGVRNDSICMVKINEPEAYVILYEHDDFQGKATYVLRTSNKLEAVAGSISSVRVVYFNGPATDPKNYWPISLYAWMPPPVLEVFVVPEGISMSNQDIHLSNILDGDNGVSKINHMQNDKYITFDNPGCSPREFITFAGPIAFDSSTVDGDLSHYRLVGYPNRRWDDQVYALSTDIKLNDSIIVYYESEMKFEKSVIDSNGQTKLVPYYRPAGRCAILKAGYQYTSADLMLLGIGPGTISAIQIPQQNLVAKVYKLDNFKTSLGCQAIFDCNTPNLGNLSKIQRYKTTTWNNCISSIEILWKEQDYPPWELGATYEVGDKVSYNNKVYICLQAHTAYAANWNPEQAPALWKLIN